ncbi:MAG: hypothetical protein LBG11_05225 [Bifidobacteriaceae bacterium]|nr:hypothetical protein [Bifidobacteriaceae bacterium]
MQHATTWLVPCSERVRAEGWLTEHSARDLILARYLAHQREYAQDAARRLESAAGQRRMPLGAAAAGQPRH